MQHFSSEFLTETVWGRGGGASLKTGVVRMHSWTFWAWKEARALGGKTLRPPEGRRGLDSALLPSAVLPAGRRAPMSTWWPPGHLLLLLFLPGLCLWAPDRHPSASLNSSLASPLSDPRSPAPSRGHRLGFPKSHSSVSAQQVLVWDRRREVCKEDGSSQQGA